MTVLVVSCFCFFFFSSRRRHTRLVSDWSSDVCSSDLERCGAGVGPARVESEMRDHLADLLARDAVLQRAPEVAAQLARTRSEERRVGKECRCGWLAEH